MTQLPAKTLAPDIRVNAVVPGLANAPMTASCDKAQTLWRDHAPMDRAADPADIADIVVVLAQPASLTGEIVIAGSGLNLT